MSEAAAACLSQGFASPLLVASDGANNGAEMLFAGSLIGDYLILWQSSSSDLTIPTPPAGYTAFGSGAASDASNDVAVIASAKKVTTNGEGIPASGPSRCIGLLFRDLDPNYLVSLTGKYVYEITPVTGLVIPALTPTRPVPILCFSRLLGTASVTLDSFGLVPIVSVTPANGEVRAAWTAETSNFSGGTIGTVPSSAQARATASIALYGKAL